MFEDGGNQMARYCPTFLDLRTMLLLVQRYICVIRLIKTSRTRDAKHLATTRIVLRNPSVTFSVEMSC